MTEKVTVREAQLAINSSMWEAIRACHHARELLSGAEGQPQAQLHEALQGMYSCFAELAHRYEVLRWREGATNCSSDVHNPQQTSRARAHLPGDEATVMRAQLAEAWARQAEGVLAMAGALIENQDGTLSSLDGSVNYGKPVGLEEFNRRFNAGKEST
jgi:hypothetical protein